MLSIVTGHKLVRLARTPNARYCLSFERAGSTVEVVSDLVVLAIPLYLAVSTTWTLAERSLMRRALWTT